MSWQGRGADPTGGVCQRSSLRSTAVFDLDEGAWTITVDVDRPCFQPLDGCTTDITVGPPDMSKFIRGDFNGDGGVDIADGVALLNALFRQGGAPSCPDAGDANDDGGLNIADAVWILNYIFAGGPPPEAPFPGCGLDPPGDGLDCVRPRCSP